MRDKDRWLFHVEHERGLVMRRIAIWVLCTVAAGCGSDGTGVEAAIPAELVGTWEAAPDCMPACGFTFVSPADPADTTNVTNVLDTTSRFTLNESGSFIFSVDVASAATTAGRVRVEGSTLVVQATAEFPEERIDFSRAGNLLTLAWRETYAFDLDNDGVAEDFIVRGVFERQ